MKKFLLIFSFLYFVSGNAQTITDSSPVQVTYKVDLTNYQDDLFHVTVDVEGLSIENDIYNLPATVPGTYSNLNFGRFVKSFKAYDKDGNEIQTEKISTNQWRIANADKLAKIDYDIEDTFDTEIEDNKVIPMAGTSINDEFILLNTFAVLGYFEGLQTNPVKLKLEYKSDWTVGTSLTINENGYYTAETYDRLVDNPILIGELTTASTTVNDIEVGVYVYSPDTTINADKIMNIAEDLLQSSSEFIGYSPVTHYNFLMCFLDQESFVANGFLGAGALEHSYSSLFVFPAFGNYSTGIQNAMAHEFLHILTPLNLHSNIIQPFNFVIPTASQHIWLYEGVTKWGSDIMQFRDGLITVEEYLKRISEKIKEKMGELGFLDYVHFAGDMDHDQFLTLLSKSTFCLRTSFKDGVSSSVLESLSLNTPVVACEDGTRPEGVITYENQNIDDMVKVMIETVDSIEEIKKNLKPPPIPDTITTEIELIKRA